MNNNKQLTIEYLECRIKEAEREAMNPLYWDSDGFTTPGHARCIAASKKAIRLIELGCIVMDDAHGFLVDNKFIIAAHKKKWRIKGKGKWYYHGKLEDFVEKYIRKSLGS